MRHYVWASALVCAAIGASASGCGSSDDEPGGAPNTGGFANGGFGNGGVAPSGGGVTSNGGVQGTGGAPSSGGVGAGGGPLPTGGVTSNGGNPGSGGIAGGGGTASGGAATTGGAAGSGGGSTVPPTKSSGCGAATFPQSGNQTLDVSGTQREFIVKIPANYQPSTPYKLVFAWHGLGGTAQQIADGIRGGYYGLEGRSNGTTIFVAGQGLETSTGGAGWPNTGGRDIAFVRAMLDYLKKSYCIDEQRIFSTGMSYGGIMSNTIGCQLGDVFRAIAPIAGSGPRSFGGQQCVGQVAAWLAHGNQDTVVTFASGQASRDHWVGANHCESTSASTTPSPCVAYQGCDEGHPVHWCEWAGGHTVPSFASEAIWNFFSQF